jgi:hypothetical protein
MRWIVITLALVNIVYFGWQVSHPDPEVLIASSRHSAKSHRSDITLVREADRASLNTLKELVNRPIDNTLLDTEKEKCTAIGPFLSIYESQNVSNQLLSMGINLQARAVDETLEESDYRLLIPPLPSLEQAFRRLRELQARNIDSYVITAGESALGISLGVFSTRQAAEAASALIKDAGFDGQIVEIRRLNRTYWLFDSAGSSLNIEEIVWQKLLNNNQSIEKRELPCE